MDKVLIFIHFFCFVLLFPFQSSSLPLCTDLRSPRIQKGNLTFCPYNGKMCCTSSQDQELQRRFRAMNISDSNCASAVKSILCATCDQFSAKLFTIDTELRPVPVLCNSTSSSFCSNVWRSCRNALISNSPFAPALQSKAIVQHNATITKLTDLWQSETDFCYAFGGVNDENSLCFSGVQIVLNETNAMLPPKGVCLEKIDNGSYLNMVPHPDGSNRVFLSNQAGKIWLAKIPDQDSGKVLELDESDPFVDLTEQVHLDATFGLMGMAFHPDFENNGRFFASFNCDKESSSNCRGRCACNLDAGCDPSELSSLDSEDHCRYHTVVVEYSANGTGSSPTVEKARPEEVRRIFTMALPFTANHGGQILFGPEDGYMYIMMGDGGSKGDPYNFAQNKKSLLGKIMRVDVDNIPSEEEIVKLGLWGNYSIPPNNPSSEDKQMEPEIWAYGLRNPWRSSFDSKRPSYFICADTGQDEYEEVNIIYKGGNYGWRVYEGPHLFKPLSTPGGNTSLKSIDPIFPVTGYSHASLNKLGSAAIMGGYIYRAQTDPCLYGSYVYADLYAGYMWSASETPENSGNFNSTRIPFSCAMDSPIKCDIVPNSNIPALQLIFSFGEDNGKDVYLLTQSGVYRVVRPSRCNYTCSKEVAAKPHMPAHSSEGNLVNQYPGCVLLVSAVLLSLMLFL